MALDRRLSRDFWLHEFSGWESASEAEVGRLADTVALVLQPIRSEIGRKVIPTSWLRWSSGEARTGSHAHGGTVDFVVADGATREAFEWASRFLIPAGYIGRLIYEPAREATASQPRQGEHIHMAPRAAMAPLGREDIQVLVETSEGRYEFFRQALGLGTLAVAALFFFPCAPRGAGISVVKTPTRLAIC